jgi:hypothetical protein
VIIWATDWAARLLVVIQPVFDLVWGGMLRDLANKLVEKRPGQNALHLQRKHRNLSLLC